MLYLADTNLSEPITTAKWVSNHSFVVGTNHGKVYLFKLEKDQQDAWYLGRPTLIKETNFESSIWSIDVDQKDNEEIIYIADDSGAVSAITFSQNGSQTIDIHVSIHL